MAADPSQDGPGPIVLESLTDASWRHKLSGWPSDICIQWHSTTNAQTVNSVQGVVIEERLKVQYPVCIPLNLIAITTVQYHESLQHSKHEPKPKLKPSKTQKVQFKNTTLLQHPIPTPSNNQQSKSSSLKSSLLQCSPNHPERTEYNSFLPYPSHTI